MDKNTIENLLSAKLIKLDGRATYPGTYDSIPKNSLYTAHVINRASKSWPKGQFLITSTQDQGDSLAGCLNKWKLVASGFKNQYLIILDSANGDWNMYDWDARLLAQNDDVVSRINMLPAKSAVNEPSLFDADDFVEGLDAPVTTTEHVDDDVDGMNAESRQVIYFGAPGTGKSHAVNSIVERKAKDRNLRTTFHPDTDYSSFVGCYKPTMLEGKIGYAFTPQVLAKAYVKAWADQSRPFYLVIEEINRGNCAQIFGDIFQLLDRGDDGASSYSIQPDADFQRYIASELGGNDSVPEKIRSGEDLKLPSNLFIYATMNTSDQSLFPIDSAFKRRWDWHYTAINPGDTHHVLVVDKVRYDWNSFVELVNDKIYSLTRSEDKQIGHWFIKPNEKGEIDCDRFVAKALFYIWNDVVKDYAMLEKDDSPFGKKFAFTTFFDEMGKAVTAHVIEFLDTLGVLRMDSSAGMDNSGAPDGNFSVNGTPVRYKNAVAAEAVKEYIKANPSKTADEIIQDWNSLGLKVSNFIQSEKEHESRQDTGKDYVIALVCNNEQIYVTKDGWGDNRPNGLYNVLEMKKAIGAKGWPITIKGVE